VLIFTERLLDVSLFFQFLYQVMAVFRQLGHVLAMAAEIYLAILEYMLGILAPPAMSKEVLIFMERLLMIGLVYQTLYQRIAVLWHQEHLVMMAMANILATPQYVLGMLAPQNLQHGVDIDGDWADDDYGSRSVSLSSDGSILAIGSPNNGNNGTYSGQVMVYAWSDGSSRYLQRGYDIDPHHDIEGENPWEYSGIQSHYQVMEVFGQSEHLVMMALVLKLAIFECMLGILTTHNMSKEVLILMERIFMNSLEHQSHYQVWQFFGNWNTW
jgi:hypothetical protein